MSHQPPTPTSPAHILSLEGGPLIFTGLLVDALDHVVYIGDPRYLAVCRNYRPYVFLRSSPAKCLFYTSRGWWWCVCVCVCVCVFYYASPPLYRRIKLLLITALFRWAPTQPGGSIRVSSDRESQANILLDKRPRGESKVISGGVFQGAPAGSQFHIE